MATTEPEAPIAERLTAHLRAGTLLNLIPNIPRDGDVDVLDEDHMRGWDASHDVDAGLLRDLLLSRGLDEPGPDPRGLRLRGARICGRLDLEFVDTAVALVLEDCLLEHGVCAEEAHLPSLRLRRCRLIHSHEPAFSGDGLCVDGGLELDGSVIIATATLGTVRLVGAQIGHPSLDRATLRNTNGPALQADRLKTIGSAFFEGVNAESAGSDGGVRLINAHIGGQLRLGGADIRNPEGPALEAIGLQTGGDAFFAGGFKAEGAGSFGAACLINGQIGGRLWFGRAMLRNDGGPALEATGLQTGGNAFFGGGFKAVGARGFGTVRLLLAQIGGQLLLTDATMENEDGPALSADGLKTGSNTYFDDGFSAKGVGTSGAVRLFDARIGGQLHIYHAEMSNRSGPAFYADGLHTVGNAYVMRGFTAVGMGPDGTVRLPDAQIGGQLLIRDADLRNTGDGPAFHADRLKILGDAEVAGRLTAVGKGSDGTVRLSDAQIGGRLLMKDADLSNTDGPAFYADRLQTGSDARFDEAFKAEGRGEDGTVRLVGARIGGQLSLAGATVHSLSSPRDRWRFDGMIYTGVPWLAKNGNRKAWLKLLHTGTWPYAAQPYQQLAAAYRAEGHDSDVRAILIAQRQDQLARGGLRPADKLWARMTGLLLRYGYQPWRALLYLAAVLAISVGLALWLGGEGGLARSTPAPATAASTTASTQSTPAPCTLIQTVGHGLALGAPFLPAAPATTGSRQITASPSGDALTVARWVLQLIAWALAALFIAGFTGIVRKT